MALRSRCITGSFRACSTIRSALTPDPLSRKSISLFSSAGQVPHHLSKAFKQVLRRGHASAPHIPLQLFRRTPRVPGAALLQQTRRPRLGGQRADLLLDEPDMPDHGGVLRLTRQPPQRRGRGLAKPDAFRRHFGDLTIQCVEFPGDARLPQTLA